MPSNIERYKSERLCVKFKPKKEPLALVSCMGVLSPEKYGKKIIPLDPAGDCSASFASSIKTSSPFNEFNGINLSVGIK